jgi:hypothetical protein
MWENRRYHQRAWKVIWYASNETVIWERRSVHLKFRDCDIEQKNLVARTM